MVGREGIIVIFQTHQGVGKALGEVKGRGADFL